MKFWKIVKRIIIFFLIVIGLILITWRIDRTFFHPYIPDFSDQIRNDITTYKFTIPKDKEGCDQASGTWKKAGPEPKESCNLPTTDGGKTCSSSKVCEGICLADLNSEEMRAGMKGKLIKTDGTCSKWVKVYGCMGIVYQGWAQVVCMD